MAKTVLKQGAAIFNPSAQQIDFTNFFSVVGATFDFANLYAVINVNAGQIIYATASMASGYGGSYSAPILYLSYNTTAMSGSDELQIIYDLANAPSATYDGTGTQPILSTTDSITGREGLDINLLNSSFGGQIGLPLPSSTTSGYNAGLSVGFINQGNLVTPNMDPMTNNLKVDIDNFPTSSTMPVSLNEVSGSGVSLGQTTSSASIPVVLANDQTPITVVAGGQDVLGTQISGNRNNQIEISFNSAPGAGLITNTFTGSGSAVASVGHTTYSTGSTPSSTARGVSVQQTTYRPAHEIYSCFTAAFSGQTGTSSQKIGLFDTSNGFFLGYNATDFCVAVRNGGIDSYTTQGSFNVDTLTGAAGSKFTRNGVPEAINTLFSNLFRIRFAWLGSANILFEVFSPDGQWVLFHNIRQPNSSLTPSIQTPNLPMTLEIFNGASSSNVYIATACWGAGTTSTYSPITATLTDNTLAAVTRSVITGVTTGGGGGYVNVKVNPSGALVTDASGSSVTVSNIPTVLSGQLTASGSISALNGSVTLTVGGYSACAIDLRGTFSATVTFQGTVDGANWITLAATPVGSAQNIALVNVATVAGAWLVQCSGCTQVRATATAYTSGTVNVVLRATSGTGWAYSAPVGATNAVAISSGTVTTVSTVTTCSTVSAVTSAALASATITDIASAAITTTTTSANVSTTNQHTFAVQIAVTATSGTGQTLDVVIQETMDGTNYYDIYHFERITAVGYYWSPPLKMAGIGIRYVRTVAGTTPSFTMAATRIHRSNVAPLFRRVFDRAIAPNTLNSTTAAMLTEGCDEINMIVSMSAGGTGPTMKIQGSDDNSNWYDMAAGVATAAGATTPSDTGSGSMLPKWVRGIVSVAGVGSTLNYVSLKGKSRG